jgi:hypothetical protein
MRYLSPASLSVRVGGLISPTVRSFTTLAKLRPLSTTPMGTRHTDQTIRPPRKRTVQPVRFFFLSLLPTFRYGLSIRFSIHKATHGQRTVNDHRWSARVLERT